MYKLQQNLIPSSQHFKIIIFSIGGTHKHSRLLHTSPSSVLLEGSWWYPLSIARRGRFHRPMVWGDPCAVLCDWALGVWLSCFNSILLVNSWCMLHSRHVDKASSLQRKNKIRIYIPFDFCLPLLFLPTRMPQPVCCILVYIKLSCRNIHYSFIVTKTHWNRGIKHLANIHLCGPNGIFEF